MPGTQWLEHVLAELPEDPVRAAQVVERSGGAQVVEQEARKLGLLSLLGNYLPTLFAPPSAEALSARFRAAQLLRATRSALATLQGKGVRALNLKGVGLAARFYPELWLRPTSDVDLLVRPADLARATAALREAGYREFQGPAESVFDFHHHCSFVTPSRELVEVHFTPACGFQSQFDVEGIFERAKQVELESGPLPVMGLEDALVHMCTHAAHHRFEGVKWLFDLKLLARGARQIQWSRAVALARQARVAAAAGMALAEAARRVRAPIPQEVIEALAPGLRRRLLARRASRIPGVGIYPLSLVLADRLTVRWAKELAARPIERTARWAGKDKEFRALVRAVLGIEERW